ncbi:MAG: hypothetical protein SCM11_13570 [Bacillota bacterium]|nr:hypothetical protein [Bacillota bacterium]
MKIFWGDLHNHCGISYGFGSLEHALRNAAVQLDFCGVTGHAMWPDMPAANVDTANIVEFHKTGFARLKNNWEQVREAVNAANREGEFVTFQTYEMHSNLYGDYHLVSPDPNLKLTNADSPETLIENCGSRSIVIPHHIGYTPGYRGINWDLFSENISPVVEVFSKHGCAMNENAPYPYYHDMGPRDSRNTVFKGLERGYHFGFVASTDHHAGYPGSYGDGKIAVLADAKTRESIWEALLNRRTYAVTGDKIKCSFTVNGAPFGSILETTGKREINLDVVGSAPVDKIIIYKNLKPFWVTAGEQLKTKPAGHYKIRVEMGWGNNSEPFLWSGSAHVTDGSFCGAETCFRGKSILSPTSGEKDNDNINKLESRMTLNTSTIAEWKVETFKNHSTLHPQTSSVVFEIEGTPSTLFSVDINGINLNFPHIIPCVTKGTCS